MTTEDDLQSLINRNPKDTSTRGLIGDMLMESGDQRGPGYLALARLGRRPSLRAHRSNEARWRMAAFPAYHGGDGLSVYTMAEVFDKLDLQEKLVAMTVEQQREVVDEMLRTIILPANPVHSLPKTWFNVCWGNFWFRDESALPWVISDDRRKLDDMVALSFNDTPNGFQDHVLNCNLPVQFPFVFNCPYCEGSGRFQHLQERKPRRKPWEETEITTHFNGLYTTVESFCVPCRGQGGFQEVYPT